MLFFRYLFGFALLALTLLSAQPSFPELTSRVVDDASLFSATQKTELESVLENHENNTSNQIVVVTLKSLEGYDIRDYGLELGRAWGIGQKDKNNGVLLIIAPNERKVSIEVGYGLEGALPDATAKSIIDQEILPYFKEGDYFGGAKFGLDAIISAIKGEYVAYINESGSDKSIGSIFMPLLFLVVFLAVPLFGKKNKFDKNNIIPALVFSSFTVFFTWIMFSILLLSITLGIIVFVSMLFADPSVYEGSGGRSSGYSGGGGFSSSSGGFSGGGGSFGGGGASGSW